MDEIGAVAVLADPVRHRLYDAVAVGRRADRPRGGRPGGGRAAALGAVPPRQAGRRRACWRSATRGSAAAADRVPGRPAKLYRRSAVEVAVSLPQAQLRPGGRRARVGARADARRATTSRSRCATRRTTRGRAIGTAYDGQRRRARPRVGRAAERGLRAAPRGRRGLPAQLPVRRARRPSTPRWCAGSTSTSSPASSTGLGCASARARLQPDAGALLRPDVRRLSCGSRARAGSWHRVCGSTRMLPPVDFPLPHPSSP